MQVGWMDKYKEPTENNGKSDIADCTYPRGDIFYNTPDTCLSSAPVIPTSHQYGLVIVSNDPVDQGDTIVSTVENLKGVDTIVTVMSSPTPTSASKEGQVKDNPRTSISNNRFKVVKIETTVPFKRGRWTCMDYLDHNDNSSAVQNGVESSKVLFNDTTVKQQPQHKQQSYATTQTNPQTVVATVVPTTVTSSNVHILSCTSEIVDDNVQQTQAITSTPMTLDVNSAAQKLTVANGGVIESDDNDTADVSESNGSEQIDPAISSTGGGVAGGGSSTGGMAEDSEANNANPVAIDNKIEQAMDLVKSHLMFAVREEVEVLKERIAELMERINQLELENVYLKSHVSPEVLSKLPVAVQVSNVNSNATTSSNK